MVDATGVTDSPLVDAKPLAAASERQISLEKLLQKCANLTIDATEAAALAGRLARLNQQISPAERDELAATGGVTVAGLARDIVIAIDPDAQEQAKVAGGASAARQLIQDAISPLTASPEFRTRILEIRRDHDITYDDTSVDNVTNLELVPRTERATATIESWRAYLDQHQSEIDAISVLTSSRRGGNEALAQLTEFAARIRRPPHAWTPASLWNAYANLGKAADDSAAPAQIPDLVSLIRFELGLDAELRLYRTVVEDRFAEWILGQEKSGTRFTAEQLWWLEQIRETIAIGVGITVTDINGIPFNQRGGQAGLVSQFGGRDRARQIVAELDREIA